MLASLIAASLSSLRAQASTSQANEASSSYSSAIAHQPSRSRCLVLSRIGFNLADLTRLLISVMPCVARCQFDVGVLRYSVTTKVTMATATRQRRRSNHGVTLTNQTNSLVTKVRTIEITHGITANGRSWMSLYNAIKKNRTDFRTTTDISLRQTHIMLNMPHHLFVRRLSAAVNSG